MRRAVTIIFAAALVTGCREGSSAFHPHSREASEIANLSWILFSGGAVILLLVVAAIWIAIRGPNSVRKHLAAPRTVIAAGIVFPAVVLCALLILNATLMQSAARPSSDRPDAVSITVTGEQWWWRVAYAAPQGRTTETANEIKIPVGRDVTFNLRSADVIHAFWVPSLAGKVDMIPGRDTRLRVHATRPGIFRGPCAEYCGGPHALMALQVTALPPEEFDAWLARESSDVTPLQGSAEQEGGRLFLASGCGTCHTVRGTQATGLIGPDLTHLASRRSIGAGTLPLDHDSLGRFIAEGQTVKPGNRMPEFRILSRQQRDALASYLLGLK